MVICLDKTISRKENKMNKLGIRGYHYVEFYVGSADKWAWWLAKAFSMKITGIRGPQTGINDRISFYLTKNNLKLVVTSVYQSECFDVSSFVNRHGDGVKRWSIEVDDVEKAYNHAIENGAVAILAATKFENNHGFVEQASIKIYDDTEIVFFNKDNYGHILMPGFCEPDKVLNMKLTSEDTGIIEIDHIVGNVRVNEMDTCAAYLNNTLDLATQMEFGPGDISTEYSSLLSIVVSSKDRIIRNPINEPYKGLLPSQIELFIHHYNGSGVQHIAMYTKDIVATISKLRENGVDFLDIPDTYYEDLRKKDITIKENIDDLQKLKILCDTGGPGYLLQIFTKPVTGRPTFFFEFIQRCDGADGFGHNNFKALFESIERDQLARGETGDSGIKTSLIC